MLENLLFLLGWVGLIALLAAVRYAVIKKKFGLAVARRELPFSILWIVLSFFALFILGELSRAGWIQFNSWFNLVNLFAILVVVWNVRGLLERQQAGVVLLDLGKAPENEQQLTLGVLWLLLSLVGTWLYLPVILSGHPIPLLVQNQITMLILQWAFALHFIISGLARFQMRAQGIWFQNCLIRWSNISQYYWEPGSRSVLTLGRKSRFPLLPHFISLSIPERNREAVDRVLVEHLSGKRLMVNS